jgi:predicted nucleic acid-binding protein
LWRPYLKDPFDDHVLELALASEAEYIVTYNKKDLIKAEDLGIKVVDSREFLEVLRKGE